MPVASKISLRCVEHNEPLKLFCDHESCKRMVCQLCCLVGSHREHANAGHCKSVSEGASLIADLVSHEHGKLAEYLSGAISDEKLWSAAAEEQEQV